LNRIIVYDNRLTTGLFFRRVSMPLPSRGDIGPVRITRIVAAPLFGESPKGGWSVEIKAEDSIHALIAVHTDAGIIGYGSVFTDGRLVEAALKVLEPLLSRRERARARARLREAAPEHLLDGPRRQPDPCHQRHRHRAVGHSRQGDRPVRSAGCWAALPRPRAALLLAADGEPAQMGDEIVRWREQGFRAFKIGWGPFGRRDDYKLDEAIVRAAKRCAAGPAAA
jgi:D-galactarolactone cycloisomerase